MSASGVAWSRAVIDWERAVEQSCKRNLIAVERSRFVAEAPPDVQDPETAIDAIQASLPALMAPVPNPDRAEWARRSPSRKARLIGLAGGLRGVQLAVFIVMTENADWTTGRNMRASLETVARESGFSLSPVRRAVRALEDDAWIRCDHRSKGGLTARATALNVTSTYSVLTLPAEPVGKLTKTKRVAVLHPERRQRAFRFIGGRSERPGSNPVGATGKRNPVGATGK